MKLTYQQSPRHHKNTKGEVTAAPRYGQTLLDESIQLSSNSTRRIAVDRESKEFVFFEETHPGQNIFHGYLRPWEKMTSIMRKVAIDAGFCDRKGKIIRGTKPV